MPEPKSGDRFSEFSFRTRADSIRRFGTEVFDLLVIGGGITGASVARDAASRGLKVALVEKRDFGWGTSSRSSKLIHGGLRYLENFEFGLVFEALAERALLLKTAPHVVRPLPFYFPVYDGDPVGKNKLGMGMWLYDLLAIFRTPGMHKRLSTRQMESEIPILKKSGLQGGFRYFDASMWDDALTVQVLRSAHAMGAAIANYVEAIAPLYGENGTDSAGRITGFRVRDREKPEGKGDVNLLARQIIVCAGPWTDSVGRALSSSWQPWLLPSKGVHLVFDHRKIPVPGALVMSHPQDGRIAFVIPRQDFGTGVTIVGTTDGPSAPKPEESAIDIADVKYLLDLLDKYFPDLKLTSADIMSAYVGVRPLMAPSAPGEGGALQKVSREHHIGKGPGGTVVVAGGKYTTARKMAQEVVDYALEAWKRAHRAGETQQSVPLHGPSRTRVPVNPMATPAAMAETFRRLGSAAPRILVERYGAEAARVLELARGAQQASSQSSPKGFPELAAQLRHTIHTEMVMHLEDFYVRRLPLEMAREDHGLPWAEELGRVWAEERRIGTTGSVPEIARELEQLRSEIARRSAWRKGLFEPKKTKIPGSELTAGDSTYRKLN